MSLADDLHRELSQHGAISEGQAWRMHDRIAELEAELADALPAVRAEQRKTARAQARIAELETEAACYEGTTANQWRNAARAAQARIAELEAEAATHKARAESELARSHRYEARLAAVISLCDHGAFYELREKVRAAATPTHDPERMFADIAERDTELLNRLADGKPTT